METGFAYVRLPANTAAKKAVYAVQSSSAKQSSAHTSSRPLADFPPEIWGDHFTSISISDSKLESYGKETEVLKEKVKRMLLELASGDPMETIRFIYSLWRLGLSYHFETEIEQQLHHIFHTQPHFLLYENDYDLHSTAIAFQVFRSNGYRMSSGVFDKFKDHNNQFKESLSGDIRGLLSLYEATFLSLHGEDILDEALAFAKPRLQMLVDDKSSVIDPHIRMYITNALKYPVHKSIVRIEVRKYIGFYEEEDHPNETLLRFAKVDYNRVQMLHQQELSEVSRWWKELDISAELPFRRDRVVESYFWVVGCHFEPHYRHARIMHAKNVLLATYLDDTFDAYGTSEEHKLLFEAIQRWDYDCVALLPDYLKPLYKAILDTFVEYEKDVITEDRSFSVQYTKETVQELVTGYYQESLWVKDGYVHVPSLEEYLGPALLTAGVPMMGASFSMGMEDVGVKEFQWFMSNPKIRRATSVITRLVNDISDHKFQQERTHIASCVECYMKEHGVSEERAVKELKKMVENAWKDVNEEVMRPSDVPRKLLNFMVDMCRSLEILHKDVYYGYTHPEYLKDMNTQLFVKEIPISN